MFGVLKTRVVVSFQQKIVFSIFENVAGGRMMHLADICQEIWTVVRSEDWIQRCIFDFLLVVVDGDQAGDTTLLMR